MRIVIVEDEGKIRSGMRKLIDAHTSHRVIGEARNGQEGLEMVERLRPDLVISDIRMPVMDGLDMLEEIHRRQIRCQMVILSGYSEFDYARRAMRFGVADYLLKPLTAEDVIQVLDKIQERISREQQEQEHTAEGLLRTILLSARSASEEDIRLLKETADFKEESYLLVAGYLGGVNPSYRRELEKVFQGLRASVECCRLCYTVLEEMKECFCLIQADGQQEAVLSYLQKKLYLFLGTSDRPVWAAAEAAGLQELGRCKEKVCELQFYGNLVGFRQLITEEALEQLKAAKAYETGIDRPGGLPSALRPALYPRHLESGIETAILRRDETALQEKIDILIEDLRWVDSDLVQLRPIFRKLLQFMENVLQETDSVRYQEVLSLEGEGIIGTAVRLDELEDCIRKAARIAARSGEDRENISNYTILRAISFIKEHYRENISLEMIADQLDITPEYLSTLFNREVGINFSAFLKKFRISHAKRLLRGSGMKIYEVAAAVGYRDPKYFNRVFKEEVGMSPGDFR